MAVQIQLRRGSAAEWTSANPILAEGEVGLELDTGKVKAGDSTTAWNGLGYVLGTQGAQGPQGSQGPAGSTGPAGAQGPAGVDGNDGVDGVDGATGAQGPEGPEGPEGAQGLQGLQGIQGLQGPAGSQGPAGNDGAPGAQGIQGPAGADSTVPGPAGDTGPAGADGAQGQQGQQGIQGPAGADSTVPGPQGEQGIQGNQGIQGIQGIQGATGVPFKRVELSVPVLAATTWTNMPAALSFWLSTATVAKGVTKVDLTGYSQVRLLVNKQGTSGAAASKLILRYKATPFTQTVANYSDIGTSEVSVATNVNNVFSETAWIDLAAGAKADVFLALLGSGGDGTLDPAFGQVTAEFK